MANLQSASLLISGQLKQAEILLLVGQPIILTQRVLLERSMFSKCGSHTAITISEMVTKL